MKKVLENNEKTHKYLESLPKMYMVGLWARYGVMELPWSGKWEKSPYSGHMEPLVWYYNDHNGTADLWYLVPIHLVTTGNIVMWTENKPIADNIAQALNFRMEQRRKSNEDI